MNKNEKNIQQDQENFSRIYESFSVNTEYPFVIDGQNFVFNLQRKNQKDGLIKLLDEVSLLGHPIFLVLPNFLITRFNLNKNFISEKNVSLIRIDQYRLDDWAILDLADLTKGLIITNDYFREFKPYYKEELFTRLIQFVVFSIHGKILIRVPFIEFIKLQFKNQSNSNSEHQDKEVSLEIESLSI